MPIEIKSSTKTFVGSSHKLNLIIFGLCLVSFVGGALIVSMMFFLTFSTNEKQFFSVPGLNTKTVVVSPTTLPSKIPVDVSFRKNTIYIGKYKGELGIYVYYDFPEYSGSSIQSTPFQLGTASTTIIRDNSVPFSEISDIEFTIPLDEPYMFRGVSFVDGGRYYYVGGSWTNTDKNSNFIHHDKIWKIDRLSGKYTIVYTADVEMYSSKCDPSKNIDSATYLVQALSDDYLLLNNMCPFIGDSFDLKFMKPSNSVINTKTLNMQFLNIYIGDIVFDGKKITGRKIIEVPSNCSKTTNYQFYCPEFELKPEGELTTIEITI